MTRSLLVLLTLACTALAAPVPKGVKDKAPPVAGTAWHHADDPHGPVTYLFDAGGKLRYTTDDGKTFGGGTWAQDGDTLTWETNGRYAEFTAAFKGGEFDGSCKNQNGKEWAVKLVKKDK